MSHEHIPTEEVLQDIADTEREIKQMERELPGLDAMPDRWSQMRALARRTGIQERKEFIAKLHTILADRSTDKTSEGMR